MIEYLELNKKPNYKNNIILNLVNVYHKTLADSNQLSETKKLFKAMPLVKSQFKETFANMRDFDKMLGKIIVTDNIINACTANNKISFISKVLICIMISKILKRYLQASVIQPQISLTAIIMQTRLF